ncbi:unannotated protein [freshwater metagenome]|uniref:Unannotated protein n=1 Tax=freshwater metagenome TaxID=449393 RepID=A0A6J7EE45_9ZZZZ
MIPVNIAIEIAPRRNSVVAAFLDLGGRNAGTPLETASMPVSAVVPDENARATTKTRANPANDASGMTCQSALSACISLPVASRNTATPIMMKIDAMKK